MALYSRVARTPLVRGPLNLVAGLSWLFKRPKFLILGAVPAVLAGAIILAATVAVAYFSGGIAGLLDPLLANLPGWLASFARYSLQAALIVGIGVLGYVLFAVIALAVGDPIYSKIAEEVERDAGVKMEDASWLIGIKDALGLAWRGIAVGLLAFMLSLIPVAGPVLAFVAAWLLLPYFLAEELLGRTLVPRGFVGEEKKQLLKKDRGAVWSFGALCQLIFLIPLLQVILMPAAVAGAALFAQELAKKYEAPTPTLKN